MISNPIWGSLGHAQAAAGSMTFHREVHLYEMKSSQHLEPVSSITLPSSHLFSAYGSTPSPDGCMAAYITMGVGFDGRVSVVSLTKGWHLHFLLDFSPERLQWASNAITLLAAKSDGTCFALLDFV